MSISRRQFLVNTGAAVVIAARGYEAWAQAANDASISEVLGSSSSAELILNSNENPLGPGKHVIDAVLNALGDDGAGAGRYVFAQQTATRRTIADTFGLRPENVLLGAGSTELLRLAVETFTSIDRPLITADPSFAAGERFATLLGHPVTKIPLDRTLRVDLDAMLDASRDAGLVYLCNPNNPTATMHSGTDLRDYIDKTLSRSPSSKILIDEAYCDYVVGASYESMIDLVDRHPQLIVARTFSKAYGMAGLRLGFIAAHPETIGELAGVRGMDMYTSYPARAGAVAALGNPAHVEQERVRNQEVRKFTQAFFEAAGLEAARSHANFVFVDVGRPAAVFEKSCLERGIKIRAEYADFPNHVRVSLGTMDEMRYATDVFASLL